MIALLGNNTIGLLIIAGIAVFILIFVPLMWIVNVRMRRIRSQTPPLCAWEYSVEQWKEYAVAYDLSNKPAGAAKVRITPKDIWIDDANGSLQKVLDGIRRCVTACKFEQNTLSFRVRGYTSTTMSGMKTFFHHDYRLPVPVGHEADAAKVRSFFEGRIAGNSSRITEYTPDDSVQGIFEETGF